MRIACVRLRDFKRFEELEIDLRSSLTGEIADRFLLLGDNGTGKTTVLQAIALCLSMASWRTRNVADFHWLGWVPGRYERWGRPVVELEVHFSQDEIDATREAARRWFHSRQAGDRSAEYVEPGGSRVVTLRLVGEHYAAGSQAELYQFRGRWYAAQLLETDPGARDLFENLPGVFWFDQFRNLATPPSMSDGIGESEGPGRLTYHIGVARLREHLNRWQLNRLTRGPAKIDFLDQLQKSYKRVFPGRSFSMPEPMYRGGVPSPEDYYFIIDDGNRSYDIEEMSAGEQAVLPLLYEFVRQQIRNSVVLIDEIDLNLHPPLAQALLKALPLLAPRSQFLLTTHSDAISGVVAPEQIYRLPGGRLCL
ncbi:MAG: AAA family ATPase [Isosphaeraceae bacterium]